MPVDLAKKYRHLIEEYEARQTDAAKFIQMVDKTEHIFTMYRYIHQYKKRIDIDKFLTSMSDFFTSDGILERVPNPEVKQVILFLKDFEMARTYFDEGDHVWQKLASQTFTPMVMQRLVEYQLT